MSKAGMNTKSQNHNNIDERNIINDTTAVPSIITPLWKSLIDSTLKNIENLQITSKAGDIEFIDEIDAVSKTYCHVTSK